jgi:hypothetical protein
MTTCYIHYRSSLDITSFDMESFLIVYAILILILVGCLCCMRTPLEPKCFDCLLYIMCILFITALITLIKWVMMMFPYWYGLSGGVGSYSGYL